MDEKLKEILFQIQENTPQAYKVLLEETYALGYREVILAIIGFLVLAGGSYGAYWGLQNSGSNPDKSSVVGAFGVLFGFCGGLLFVKGLSDAITIFLSPNMELIQNLLRNV